MRLQWRNLLLSSALFGGAWAKKDEPGVDIKKFDFIPSNLNYFEDSDVILFEDEISRNVWRSEDAGVTWGVVDGIPKQKTLLVVMHPSDAKRAYALTNGRSHWMTDDRGKTWEEFYTDALVTLWRSPMAFHGTDPDRIIFNGMTCTGIFCEEMVRNLLGYIHPQVANYL
jgi:hypothetical protein